MQGETILIMLVEDNVDHAELVMRTLADHRIPNRVIHMDNGQTALDYLFGRREFEANEQPRPHVILLDLRLPRVDGLEVLQTIKNSAELRHIPVVILTSSDAEKDVVRAYNHYVNSYLVKPVGFDEFTRLMNDLGYYWLNWNTSPHLERL
jgi:CheY-like chemotaxis protein